MTEPRRILIIKPSALGDVVHTLPVLPLIRRRFPRAAISWLIAPAFAGIIAGHQLASAIEKHAVATRVNASRADDPGLIDPIA